MGREKEDSFFCFSSLSCTLSHFCSATEERCTLKTPFKNLEEKHAVLLMSYTFWKTGIPLDKTPANSVNPKILSFPRDGRQGEPN